MLGTMGELCQENPPIIKIALLFQTDTAIGDILYFVSFQEIYLATFPMVSLGLLDSTAQEKPASFLNPTTL